MKRKTHVESNYRSTSASPWGPVGSQPLPRVGRGLPLSPIPTDLSEPSVPVVSPQRRLLTVKGAADYLSISSWRIRGLIHKGVLVPIRLPLGDGREERKFLLDLEDLDNLVRRSKQ